MVFAFILIMIIVPMVIQMFAPNPVTNFLGNDLGITFWFLLGAVIMMLMGIEKSKTAILNYIPWDLVMLLVGMCVLFGEAGPLGVVDTLGNAVGHVPAWLIAPAIAAVGGLLSMFVSGSVLSPFFASLTPALAAAANVSPSFMMAAIIVGMGVSAVSPFSGAGATTLSGVDDNDIRDKCAKTMFKTACINIPIFSALIAVAQFIV